MYATLYFAIHEEKVISSFSSCLPFYRRFIDDGFGIWIPPTKSPDTRWNDFQSEFCSFGGLSWTFTNLTKQVDFLDVTCSFTSIGKISTQLFEKALNLYLYLPPHSAHPPGCLKGLIIGTFRRINRLTSDPKIRLSQFRSLYKRLRARGYTPDILQPLFETALTNSTARPPTLSGDRPNPIFLHIPFHPLDPPSSVPQKVFRETILQPKNKSHLSSLLNHKGQKMPDTRLIVAYHRPRNLGNLLSPRRFCAHGVSVSDFLQNIDDSQLRL
jgi:hypothetical protein